MDNCLNKDNYFILLYFIFFVILVFEARTPLLKKQASLSLNYGHAP